jgi:hypothetical protein
VTITVPNAPPAQQETAAAVFAAPDWKSDLTAFDFRLYSDAALTDALTPGSAMVTHAVAYAADNGPSYTCADDFNNCTLLHWINGTNETLLDVCGVNYDVPWGSGRDSSSPPLPGAPIAQGDCSVSFDPNAPFDVRSLPPLAYDGGSNTINGTAGPWTILLSVTTDLGDCTYVCGVSFCV